MHHAPPPKVLLNAVALNLALGCLAVVPLAVIYRSWFDLYSVPLRGTPEQPGLWGDLMNMFAAWHRVAVMSIFDEDTFPLWNRFVHGGEPFFAKPQVAVITVATALGALFPFPVSIKLDILFHVLMGATGTVVLCRALGASRVVAVLCAATAVLNQYYVFHLHRGHLNFVNGFAYVPWWLWALWRALRVGERQPHRFALLLGVLGAGAVYEGGDVALMYGAVLIFLVTTGVLVMRPSTTALRKAVLVGAVSGVTAVGLAAFKLLPLAQYMRLGNRREGVPWHAAAENGEMLNGPAIHTAGLALALLAVLAVRRHRGWAVGLLACAVVGYAASHHAPTFRVLYDHVPLVNAQRHPQRAEAMTVLAVPVLWALGYAGLRRVLRARRVWARVVVVPLAFVVWHHARTTPPPTPVTDARVEPAENPFMARARTLAGDQRVHVLENVNRHWGMEHVTVPNGVENLIGTEAMWLPEFLSAQFYIPTQWAYLDAVPLNPARIWGLLSVALVSAQTPQSIPGLTLLEQLPPCPSCMPRRSAGPFLYRNSQALPRMFTVDRVVLFTGVGREADLHWQSLLVDDAWDPNRVALIRTGVRGQPPTAAHVTAAHLVLEHPSQPLPANLAALARKRLTTSGTSLIPLEKDALTSLTVDAPLATPVTQQRDGAVYRGCITGGAALVVSSKLALSPGWQAQDEQGTQHPVFIGNGVATVVPLEGATGCVTLRYRPATVLAGALVSLTTAPVVLAALLWRRRRAAPQVRPVPA